MERLGLHPQEGDDDDQAQGIKPSLDHPIAIPLQTSPNTYELMKKGLVIVHFIISPPQKLFKKVCVLAKYVTKILLLFCM